MFLRFASQELKAISHPPLISNNENRMFSRFHLPALFVGKIPIFSQVLHCERNPLREKKSWEALLKILLEPYFSLSSPPPPFFFVIILKKRYAPFVPNNDQVVCFHVQVILDVLGGMTSSSEGLKLWSRLAFIFGNINTFLCSPSSPSALTITGILAALRTINVCWGKTRERIWWRALHCGQKSSLISNRWEAQF